MNPKNRIILAFIIILLTVSVCCVSFRGRAEESFEVRRIGNIHPYADNVFIVRSSEAGTLCISIRDNLCVYRTITEELSAGETKIHWDGCGYNREKLYEKTYTIAAELTTASGQIRSISFDSPVEYAAQCLQYALPSDDTLYLDSPEQWFLEYRTVTKGTVMIDIVSSEDPSDSCSYSIKAVGGKIARKTFRDIAGKKQDPSPGNYTLSVYEYSRPDEKYEYQLYIAERIPEEVPIALTGEIMPERGMSDEEIWKIMMKPSVVIDIDSFKHQEVYSEPDTGSPSLGTLHGQSQAVKVIRISEEWAKIGAWNHEEAAYIEGWVPLSKLKTVRPRDEYGILIDKQKQTMTIYQNGMVLDTLLVSTGRAEKNSLYQETSAGCFLTGYHRVNFSMNGKKYDYVIQYDGGNLLHQTPYDWGQQKKDFTLGRGYLGAKASHACIRIQPEPGAGGLNAYWLFSHIPYHTRIIILDDPWERESTAEKLKRDSRNDVDLSVIHMADALERKQVDQVMITFGGCIIPGGSRSFNSRKESFSSFVAQNGYKRPMSNLQNVFVQDDLTCVNLYGTIQGNVDVFLEDRNTLFGSAGTEQIFKDQSIDLVQMTSDRLLSAGMKEYEQTAEALRPYADVLLAGQYTVCTLQGHVFGFTGCTESEYLKNPETVDQRIGQLKSAGCERTVILINWSDGHEPAHSIVQEAMAHRCIRAGADLVVGNCAGIVQGIDLIEDVPVIYSLGDLLNGSTANKPKNQQGILVRAVFRFHPDTVDVIVMPILPYGSAESKENEFCPDDDLSSLQYQNAIRNIWQDSSNAAMDRIIFYAEGQS